MSELDVMVRLLELVVRVSMSVLVCSCDITAVFGLFRDTLPKCQLTKNHIVFGQTEAWSRAS